MGVHRVLVSLLDFKSSVAGHKPAGWVRFPHAPANYTCVFWVRTGIGKSLLRLLVNVNQGAFMIIKNEDVKELLVEIPAGHKHIIATLVLQDGTALTLQEATIANLVRAYTNIKTHPTATIFRLIGKKLQERKNGYAEWQLVEE